MSEYNERMKAEKDGKVQFIGGESTGAQAPPPPPPGFSSARPAATDVKKVEGPPPVTYSFNPKASKKKK